MTETSFSLKLDNVSGVALRTLYETLMRCPKEELAECCVDMYVRLKSMEAAQQLPEWHYGTGFSGAPQEETEGERVDATA